MVEPTAGSQGTPRHLLHQYDNALNITEQAIYHRGLLPISLTGPTRRSLTGPLGAAILYAGRAQPTLATMERRLQRSDVSRLQVALRHTRQHIVILRAHHLHPLDLRLFASTADAADVDLWLVPSQPPDPSLRDALTVADVTNLDRVEATAAWDGVVGGDGRRLPGPCESALPLGAGTEPARECSIHHDAAGCVIASFGDALIAARTHALAIRHRLHELCRGLPEEAKWSVFAAARDPFMFVERALLELGITHDETRSLNIGSLSDAGHQMATIRRVIDVPEHLRGVLVAHRDIRVAEGSTSLRPFCIPTDDRTRRTAHVR